jgi:hypothetical protein
LQNAPQEVLIRNSSLGLLNWWSMFLPQSALPFQSADLYKGEIWS